MKNIDLHYNLFQFHEVLFRWHLYNFSSRRSTGRKILNIKFQFQFQSFSTEFITIFLNFKFDDFAESNTQFSKVPFWLIEKILVKISAVPLQILQGRYVIHSMRSCSCPEYIHMIEGRTFPQIVRYFSHFIVYEDMKRFSSIFFILYIFTHDETTSKIIIIKDLFLTIFPRLSFYCW